jgi:hypothetical protein
MKIFEYLIFDRTITNLIMIMIMNVIIIIVVIIIIIIIILFLNHCFIYSLKFKVLSLISHFLFLILTKIRMLRIYFVIYFFFLQRIYQRC